MTRVQERLTILRKKVSLINKEIEMLEWVETLDLEPMLLDEAKKVLRLLTYKKITEEECEAIGIVLEELAEK